ncbi:MAG: BNR repeat-containing protein [Granulosicoccus sp.]|nr:BNR repeat-containing protein [Granulosicoccus sp.]
MTQLTAGLIKAARVSADSLQLMLTWMTRRWVIGILLFALLLIFLQVTLFKNDTHERSDLPSGIASLVTVPDSLDNQYKYNVNSLSDLVTYEDNNGHLQQAYLYWASDRRLHIVRRSFPTGEFEEPVDVHAAIGNDVLEYDSHNSSALGVAGNGALFITGNHHVDPLNLGKTRVPFDISSFYYVDSGLVTRHSPTGDSVPVDDSSPGDTMLPSDINRVTYPSFFYLDGILHFSYREQDTGKNAPRFRWMIARYEHATDRWKRSAQLHTGIRLRLYVSNFAVSPDGSTVHVFALWRDDRAGGGVSNQHDYLHLYSTDGINWYNYQAGLVVSDEQRLWFDNGDRTLPGYTGLQLTPEQLIWDTPPDPVPVNGGAAVVDAAGNPHALVRSQTGPLYHHHWDGHKWIENILPDWAGHSHDLVACGKNVGALLADKERIVYRSLNAEQVSYANPVVLAEDFTNAGYTLSVDKTAAKMGYVSFLLTKATHHEPGSVREPNPQPAWVSTFSCADLESVASFRRIDAIN